MYVYIKQLEIDIYLDYTYMYVVTFGSLGSNSMS